MSKYNNIYVTQFLKDQGIPLDSYVLLKHSTNRLTLCVIENSELFFEPVGDDDLYDACAWLLRKRGNIVFESLADAWDHFGIQ